jgi:hypothetical protein
MAVPAKAGMISSRTSPHKERLFGSMMNEQHRWPINKFITNKLPTDSETRFQRASLQRTVRDFTAEKLQNEDYTISQQTSFQIAIR